MCYQGVLSFLLYTRPSAKVALENICEPKINKHVELLGFKEEERKRYISEISMFSKEKQERFFKYMFSLPHIKSMMYIPLNCAIIAQVYYESQVSHIPKTRTELYKAITNCILVRYTQTKTKEDNYKHLSMLPEGLMQDDMKSFKALAKFAFDSYHQCGDRKVTFFNEDIPEGLVHFGFMNESTEMYANKGVERTFSFLHLSLQEYLAAWHLANSYSVCFQLAYHKLALYEYSSPYPLPLSIVEERALSLVKQVRKSLVEPAIFLSGITGLKYQSNEWHRWKMHLKSLSEKPISESCLLSLYEAQNPEIIPYYFESGDDHKCDIAMPSHIV